jgi:ferric-dicitrate binding protein FerR (iron transport regulator)
MDNKIKIEELLKKFKRGELSASEARELSQLTKEGDKNESLKDLLADYWQQKSVNVEVPSERMFNKIQSEILSKETKIAMLPQRFSLSGIRHLYKYAAVILLTIGLTLFINYYLSQNSGTSGNLAEESSLNIITVSYGSKSKVTLPDGSVVNLNSGSTLQYPAKFSNTSRNVFIEGEAFFNVRRDAKHPFYVKTKDITIKVLGTKFNVKAYSDEKKVETTLVSGSVEIYSSNSDISKKNRLITLQPNQQVTIETESGNSKLSDKRNNKELKQKESIKPINLNKQVDLSSIIAWTDNRLVFRDETFAELSRRLERWYDVEIDIKDPDLRNVLFSGVFVKETIEQALSALTLATPFRYQMNKNQITIYK